MQQFTRALGVQCTYCHVEVTAPLLTAEEQAAAAAAAPPAAGRGRGRGRGAGPQMDYASDDKRQKQTARLMLTLVNDINVRLAAAVHKPSSEIVRVQCATCHRGITNPAQLSDLLRQTMLGKGESAAVAQYRELRQGYLNGGAYDFREAVLLDLGRESLATRKPDDALAWLQLNLEFYPQSAPTLVALAQAHIAKRDPDAARSDLQKALTLDPGNAEARRLQRAMPK
jgi:tetratricopeptide (TPR) repeat protein